MADLPFAVNVKLNLSNNYLTTESEVVIGKSQTEALRIDRGIARSIR